jgi:hypothetical protein
LWPLALAVVFFLICTLLALAYPSSFWMVTDYEPLGLADALNMAYRLADRQMYEAVGMSYHPGVTFYLMSWLALALAGYPVASGADFFSTVLAHVEDYHRIILILGALARPAFTSLRGPHASWFPGWSPQLHWRSGWSRPRQPCRCL